MAHSFRIEFGYTMTKTTAGARPHYFSVSKIVKAREKANSQFKT